MCAPCRRHEVLLPPALRRGWWPRVWRWSELRPDLLPSIVAKRPVLRKSLLYQPACRTEFLSPKIKWSFRPLVLSPSNWGITNPPTAPFEALSRDQLQQLPYNTPLWSKRQTVEIGLSSPN